jgi:hypothetical protein
VRALQAAETCAIAETYQGGDVSDFDFQAELERTTQAHAKTLRNGMDFARQESARRIAELEAQVASLQALVHELRGDWEAV